MRESDLTSPNIGGKGYHLRRIMAQAISQLQVNAYANGKHPSSVGLSAFLTEALAASDALLPVVPVLAFTPTAKTYSIAAGETAGPTLAVGGSEGIVSYASDDTDVATVDPVTGEVTGLVEGTANITATITASGGYLTTTKVYVATVGV